MKIYELTGQKFGRLEVISKHPEKNKHGQSQWNCVCDCGTEVIVRTNALVQGHKQSCGCLVKELSSQRNRTHGMRDKPIYRVYDCMKKRCYNKAHDNYHLYGERGIGICQQWLENSCSFFDWAFANGYKEGLQIDRIDPEKGYSPENCRFLNRTCNGLNKRAYGKSGALGLQEKPDGSYQALIGLKGKGYSLGYSRSAPDLLKKRNGFVNSFIDKFGQLLDEELTSEMCEAFVKEWKAANK